MRQCEQNHALPCSLTLLQEELCLPLRRAEKGGYISSDGGEIQIDQIGIH
jgi:hypothetical protein